MRKWIRVRSGNIDQLSESLCTNDVVRRLVTKQGTQAAGYPIDCETHGHYIK